MNIIVCINCKRGTWFISAGHLEGSVPIMGHISDLVKTLVFRNVVFEESKGIYRYAG